ncbi:MAG TPA: hypothetical protein VN081_01025 [Dongiaceae bacterium]|nr:hypothetical protein [Dongiaceae bacterium]
MKMSLSKRVVATLGIFLIAASIIAILPRAAKAEDPAESITLSAVRKNYAVTAGQTLTDTLTVLNDGQTAYDFTVYATPYSVTNSAYDGNFTADKPNADAYTWIQFEKTTYHAEPRQTITIPYTINVKKDASPGGHYGAIFAEIQPESSGAGATISIHRRVGTLIYATVAGDVHLSGQASTPVINWFQTQPPITATSSVQNTGNSDFLASVTYTVKNIFGSVKYTAQNDYEVLPQTTRDIPLSWSGASWFGLYHVSVATTVLGHVTSHDAYVLVMPVWLILLLVLVAIGGGVYAFTRQVRKARS